MPLQLEFHEVTPERWHDFERLFEAPGGPSYCWCMPWRPLPAASRSDRAAKKSAMHDRVQDKVPIGILGYSDGDPVAWCSIAPRETYRELGGPREPSDEPGCVWSLACMYVPRRLRGCGVTRELITAAVEHARAKGAAVVEAYPVDPDSHSYLYMGFVSSFEKARFREVGRAGSRRHVMRLRL